MIDWTTILTNVGSFTAFSGFIAWLIKTITKSYVDKDIEKFKADLNLSFLKSQRIYDERLKVLRELYEKLVTLQIAMKEMTAILKYVKQDPEAEEKERINKAGSAYNEFYLFYRKNKILFPPKTCTSIDELIKKYFSSLWNYNSQNKYQLDDIEKETEIFDVVHKEIPESLTELENDFRKLMGAETVPLTSASS